MSHELAIIQPYVPAYRVPFFSRLVEELASDGIRCRVLATPPQGAQALRGDAAESSHPWEVRTSARSANLLVRRVEWAVGAREVLRAADGVIVGLVGTSVDTHRAIARATFRGQRLGLWGHVAAYVNTAHPADVAVETWQMRRADHVFAYTRSGAEAAVRAGIAATRVTAVMNSVDTAPLEHAVTGLTDAEVAAFVARHELVDGKTFAFIGGLDESKRIDVLVDALDALWLQDPDVRLVVGGQGELVHLLEPAVTRGQVVLLGRVGDREKALMTRTSRGILMPGRIGLVAVESLAMGLPILTTRWPFHAPEAEYLVEGSSVLTSDDDVDSYVDLVLSVARTPLGPRPTWTHPTLDDMVANFARGVRSMYA